MMIMIVMMIVIMLMVMISFNYYLLPPPRRLFTPNNFLSFVFLFRPFSVNHGVNGGLSRLHSADEDAVSWLTNYGK